MKKITAIILALTMLLSFPMVVFADGTTTLTTTVPAATYTLNIPADQEIVYGSTISTIGKLGVTDASGFTEGKNLKVTITCSDFSSESTNTTIPFSISAHLETNQEPVRSSIEKNGSIYFYGQSTGGTKATFSLINSTGANSGSGFKDTLNIHITDSNWSLALAGEYKATITFTSEVVIATK